MKALESSEPCQFTKDVGFASLRVGDTADFLFRKFSNNVL